MAKFTADAFISNMESRLGENGQHVWSFYKLPRGTAYCAGEISYTFNKIGYKSKWYDGRPVFYVPYAQEWMARNYKIIYDGRTGAGSLANAQKGDIVIFSWKKWSRDHIGAVYKTTKSNSVLSTIEGNTSGGKVDTREREKKYIHSIYRPPWNAKEDAKTKSAYAGTYPTLPEKGYFKRGDIGQQVKYIQLFLNWAMDYSLNVDGIYGPQTARAVLAFQVEYGLKRDAEFGKQCLKQARKVRK